MKTLDELAATTPLRRSLPDNNILPHAVALCRDICGAFEQLPPLAQHNALSCAEKEIHDAHDTRNDLVAETAYCLLFNYHADLLEERFDAFTARFKERAWTKRYDTNFLGAKGAYNAPETHGIEHSGFYDVARTLYLRAERDGPVIEKSCKDAGAKPMAYRMARWAVVNFHLFLLGLEQQEHTPSRLQAAVNSALNAGRLTMPNDKDFWQVRNTVRDIYDWLRDHDAPNADNYRLALTGIVKRLHELSPTPHNT